VGSTREERRRAGRNGRVAGWVAILGVAGLACAPAGPTGHAGAAPEPGRPDPVSAEPSPLRIGTSGDYAPFSRWPEGEPEPTGFSADVARAFARAQGRRIEWIRFAWPELTSALEAGRFELALSGITIRPDRSLAGRFSLPLTTTGAVALVAETARWEGRGELDRPGVRIAVNRGGHLERVARSLFPRATVEAIPDNAAVPRRLADGRADAVVTDDLEAPHWQATLPRTRAIGPLTRDAKAAWFPIGGEALARDFDRWLLRFEADEGLAALRARHGLAETRTAAPIPALLASLDERLSLMPEVARAKGVLARPIEDAAQERRVHDAVRRATERAAAELGVTPPPDTALRRFIETQLRAARLVQERTLAARTKELTLSPASTDADREIARRALDERIRPALGFITERIAWLLVAARTEGAESPVATKRPAPRAATSREAVARALDRHALPAALEAEIQAALEALLAPPITPASSARESAPAPRARSAPRDTAPSA
jgi:cyclohexadienyl dehydratase